MNTPHAQYGNDLEAIARRARDLLAGTARWRVLVEQTDTLGCLVRRGVLQPPERSARRAVLITVEERGALGYGATTDLSADGLAQAAKRARRMAAVLPDRRLGAGLPADATDPVPAFVEPWADHVDMTLAERIEWLHDLEIAMAIDDRIHSRAALLETTRRERVLLDQSGREQRQVWRLCQAGLRAVAVGADGNQWRSHGHSFQGPATPEQLAALDFTRERAAALSRDALALLDAPECPTGTRDLILLPEQMTLQIHESIGHPLELDRILGDERNYAGWSFVRPEDFGTLQYGSPQLNVLFAPDELGEFASYACDDEGLPARRTHLIRDGLLERPLGGARSAARAGLEPVACTRATSALRPPIDRMANLNIAPGEQSLGELIGGVEHGVLLGQNRSWSIDQRREKFQFGCEWGRLIEDGELQGLVRNPNYRGRTLPFWHSLDGVGGADTFQVLGLGNCGKGEPNQSIGVGHASPACRFRGIEVFGGAA